jgi:uncharacterized OB-fold protein
MKLLEPPETPESKPFWDATRDERLVLPYCTTCGAYFWYPRPACPTCLDEAVEWRPAAGTGSVYAVSVQHKAGMGRDPSEGPYAVALVDLTEGVRILSNVVGPSGRGSGEVWAPDDVAVGDAVRVVWQELSDQRRLPLFTPA